jgi:hypothetical protein
MRFRKGRDGGNGCVAAFLHANLCKSLLDAYSIYIFRSDECFYLPAASHASVMARYPAALLTSASLPRPPGHKGQSDTQPSHRSKATGAKSHKDSIPPHRAVLATLHCNLCVRRDLRSVPMPRASIILYDTPRNTVCRIDEHLRFVSPPKMATPVKLLRRPRMVESWRHLHTQQMHTQEEGRRRRAPCETSIAPCT